MGKGLLTSIFDVLLLGGGEVTRAALNLGGIANLTVVPGRISECAQFAWKRALLHRGCSAVVLGSITPGRSPLVLPDLTSRAPGHLRIEASVPGI